MLIKIISIAVILLSSFLLGYFIKDIKDEIYDIDVTPWDEEEYK